MRREEREEKRREREERRGKERSKFPPVSRELATVLLQ
jgi:hypothetical protein